jgi:hypothetical protein
LTYKFLRLLLVRVPFGNYRFFYHNESTGILSQLVVASLKLHLHLKKSSRGQNGELCSNRPKIALPTKKINLDNKTRFG